MTNANQTVFPYSDRAPGKYFRLTAIIVLSMAALFFLSEGTSPSLLDHRHRTPRLSDDQNLFVNWLTAFVFASVAFYCLLTDPERKKHAPRTVILTPVSVQAPEQGVSNRPVEIAFADVTDLHKLSVDGIWEFNIYGGNDHIRIPKSSLEIFDDFETLIASVAQRVPHCSLRIEERIIPPTLES